MVTQRHPSSNTTHSRGNWSTDDHTYAATCWRRYRNVPSESSATGHVREQLYTSGVDDATHRHVNHNFRRNDLPPTQFVFNRHTNWRISDFFLQFRTFAQKHVTWPTWQLQSLGGPRQTGARRGRCYKRQPRRKVINAGCTTIENMGPTNRPWHGERRVLVTSFFQLVLIFVLTSRFHLVSIASLCLSVTVHSVLIVCRGE